MRGIRTAGLLARFRTADELVGAVRTVRERGYRDLEACSPFPVEGLGDLLDPSDRGVKLLVLVGALVGAGGGFLLQWYTAVHAYPFDIGGRPLNSWPAFMIVVFELAVLVAALAGFFGMLALNGLPRLHHPLFGAEGFELASRGRFFLLVAASDPEFDRAATRELLEGLGPEAVVEVGE
ncbi:MAG TPA: DUF3341 domain-containing protein [Steroidobacteraceae bacterium]|nr:DUF3341 domain-containing protein [Steroidobacteraceae bacterium]